MPSVRFSKTEQVRRRYNIPDLSSPPPAPSPPSTTNSSSSSGYTSENMKKPTPSSSPRPLLSWLRSRSFTGKKSPGPSPTPAPQAPPALVLPSAMKPGRKTQRPPLQPSPNSLMVPARVQELINKLTSLDAALEEVTWEVLTHRCSLRNSKTLGETVGLLRIHHVALKAHVAALRQQYTDCTGELYVLSKVGIFQRSWEDALVSDMVRKRLERLVGYLGEDLEEVETELKEAEVECLLRDLRPAGLELSLVFAR